MEKTKEIAGIVERYKEEGYKVSEEEVDEIMKHCIRKMEVTGVEEREAYFPILFEDELVHYFIRNAINAVTVLIEIAKEAKESVCFMQTESMRQPMPECTGT